MHVQSCCFAHKPIAFFDVPVAVAVAVAYAPLKIERQTWRAQGNLLAMIGVILWVMRMVQNCC